MYIVSELLGDRRGSAGDSMLNESGRWCVLGACVYEGFERMWSELQNSIPTVLLALSITSRGARAYYHPPLFVVAS